jgi:hypothetical protein
VDKTNIFYQLILVLKKLNVEKLNSLINKLDSVKIVDSVVKLALLAISVLNVKRDFFLLVDFVSVLLIMFKL